MKSELYMGCITVGPGMPVWAHTPGSFSWLAEAAAAKNDSNCGFISRLRSAGRLFFIRHSTGIYSLEQLSFFTLFLQVHTLYCKVV